MDLDGDLLSALIALPVGMVLSVLTQGAVARIAVQDEGTRGWGVTTAILLFALGVAIGSLTTLGLTLVLLPGMVVFVGSSVAASALATEGAGVATAWNRSFALTRGERWPVFGIFCVLGGFYMVLLVIEELVGAWLVGGIDALYNRGPTAACLWR